MTVFFYYNNGVKNKVYMVYINSVHTCEDIEAIASLLNKDQSSWGTKNSLDGVSIIDKYVEYIKKKN